MTCIQEYFDYFHKEENDSGVSGSLGSFRSFMGWGEGGGVVISDCYLKNKENKSGGEGWGGYDMIVSEKSFFFILCILYNLLF